MVSVQLKYNATDGNPVIKQNLFMEWFLKTFIDLYLTFDVILLHTFTQKHLLYSNLCVYWFVSCAFVVCY